MNRVIRPIELAGYGATVTAVPCQTMSTLNVLTSTGADTVVTGSSGNLACDISGGLDSLIALKLGSGITGAAYIYLGPSWGNGGWSGGNYDHGGSSGWVRARARRIINDYDPTAITYNNWTGLLTLAGSGYILQTLYNSHAHTGDRLDASWLREDPCFSFAAPETTYGFLLDASGGASLLSGFNFQVNIARTGSYAIWW